MQLLKGKTILPVILFLLVVILVILMVSNTTYVPYTRNEMFPTYATYEGLANNESLNQADNIIKGNTAVKTNTIDTSPSSILGNLFNNPKEGFSIHNSPQSNNEVIDKISQASDDTKRNDGSCPSGGLTNSRGAICLTPELVQLLKTRGGNI